MIYPFVASLKTSNKYPSPKELKKQSSPHSFGMIFKVFARLSGSIIIYMILHNEHFKVGFL